MIEKKFLNIKKNKEEITKSILLVVCQNLLND
jgi:hypothetical protein